MAIIKRVTVDQVDNMECKGCLKIITSLGDNNVTYAECQVYVDFYFRWGKGPCPSRCESPVEMATINNSIRKYSGELLDPGLCGSELSGWERVYYEETHQQLMGPPKADKQKGNEKKPNKGSYPDKWDGTFTTAALPAGARILGLNFSER